MRGIWRTVPMLVFHPGQLTRRYIAGERAKFVSPLALFLFTVFLIFAVFNAVSGSSPSASVGNAAEVTARALEQNRQKTEASLVIAERERAGMVAARHSDPRN